MLLKNPTDQPILFKIKTTAPKRYCVRPNSGLLEPNNSLQIGSKWIRSIWIAPHLNWKFDRTICESISFDFQFACSRLTSIRMRSTDISLWCRVWSPRKANSTPTNWWVVALMSRKCHGITIHVFWAFSVERSEARSIDGLKAALRVRDPRR